jgi:hypothetical protein
MYNRAMKKRTMMTAKGVVTAKNSGAFVAFGFDMAAKLMLGACLGSNCGAKVEGAMLEVDSEALSNLCILEIKQR